MGIRRVGWGTVAAVCAGLLVVLSGWPARAAAEPDRQAAAQLYVSVNAERSAAGLAPLVLSTPAAEIAEGWSQFMSDIDDLAHNDAWFAADTKQRVGAGAVGENVATNVDVADAHRRLMNSPGHRANILDPRFTHVGIGVVRGPTGAWWITEDFFQLRSAPQVAPSPAPAAPPTTVAAPPPSPTAVAATTRPAPPPPAPVATTAPPVAATPTADDGGVEAAASVVHPAIEPRELPASDPPLAAQQRAEATVDAAHAPRPIVPVAVALLLLAANTQRVRTLRRR